MTSENEPLDKLEYLAQRQSAEERFTSELMSAIPEALPDAIVVVDFEGKIRFVNQRTELLLGYSRRELVNQKVEMLIPEVAHDSHVHHRESFWEDPRPRLMGAGRLLKARDRSGKELMVEIMLSPLITTQGRFVIALIRRSRAIQEELSQGARS